MTLRRTEGDAQVGKARLGARAVLFSLVSVALVAATSVPRAAGVTVMTIQGTLTPILPYPNLGPVEYRDNGGNSSYHGGEVTLEKRFSHGLSFRTAVTRTPSPSSSNCNRSPARTPNRRRTSRGIVTCPLLVTFACFLSVALIIPYFNTRVLTFGIAFSKRCHPACPERSRKDRSGRFSLPRRILPALSMAEGARRPRSGGTVATPQPIPKSVGPSSSP